MNVEIGSCPNGQRMGKHAVDQMECSGFKSYFQIVANDTILLFWVVAAAILGGHDENWCCYNQKVMEEVGHLAEW